MFGKTDAFFVVRAHQNLCQNQLSTSPLTLSTSPFRSLPLLHHDLFIHISLLITIFYILNLLLTIIHKTQRGRACFSAHPRRFYKRFTYSFLLEARWNRNLFLRSGKTIASQSYQLGWLASFFVCWYSKRWTFHDCRWWCGYWQSCFPNCRRSCCCHRPYEWKYSCVQDYCWTLPCTTWERLAATVGLSQQPSLPRGHNPVWYNHLSVKLAISQSK